MVYPKRGDVYLVNLDPITSTTIGITKVLVKKGQSGLDHNSTLNFSSA